MNSDWTKIGEGDLKVLKAALYTGKIESQISEDDYNRLMVGIGIALQVKSMMKNKSKKK